METCLVFPRLICKSQWGWECPRLAGIVLKSKYTNLLHKMRNRKKTVATSHVSIRAMSIGIYKDNFEWRQGRNVKVIWSWFICHFARKKGTTLFLQHTNCCY